MLFFDCNAVFIAMLVFDNNAGFLKQCYFLIVMLVFNGNAKVLPLLFERFAYLRDVCHLYYQIRDTLKLFVNLILKF